MTDEECRLCLERLNLKNQQQLAETVLKMREDAAELAKYYQAHIKELEAFAELVIEELDVAALDDCGHDFAAVLSATISSCSANFRHTREAIYKIKGRAAELLEGTHDDE